MAQSERFICRKL